MSNATIVEILLALITAMIGFGSYIGATRAQRAQAGAAIADIDADAYVRARTIYESAITTLESQITRLGTQLTTLESEVTRLQVSNHELRQSNRELHNEVTDLREANTKMEAKLMGKRDV